MLIITFCVVTCVAINQLYYDCDCTNYDNNNYNNSSVVVVWWSLWQWSILVSTALKV